MEYRIAHASSRQGLEEHVNQEMQEGWKPLGGLVVDEAGSQTRLFYQAMVKKD